MKRKPPVMANRRRRVKGAIRRGASAVEFAIVANILLIMILTCLEFARMNMVRNLAQDAAYYAARQAMVPGATASEAEAEVERIMGALLSNGYYASISPLDENSSSVTVTVGVDFAEVALFAPLFMPNSVIETTVRMRTERYDGFFRL